MDLASIHGHLLGFVIIGGWAVIGGWALGLRLMHLEDTPMFWRAVSAVQILLAVQLILGLILLALGRRPGAPGGQGGYTLLRHLNYGVISPLVVLLVAHRVARSGRWSAHAIFAIVGLVNFGLAGMAWNVGIGRL